MKKEYLDLMEAFHKTNMETMKGKDDQFNRSEIDVLDYFPKGWNSCFTYLNENLLRLDSMIGGDKITEELLDEKFGDLLNYVQLSYVVMMHKLEYVK